MLYDFCVKVLLVFFGWCGESDLGARGGGLSSDGGREMFCWFRIVIFVYVVYVNVDIV